MLLSFFPSLFKNPPFFFFQEEIYLTYKNNSTVLRKLLTLLVSQMKSTGIQRKCPQIDEIIEITTRHNQVALGNSLRGTSGAEQNKIQPGHPSKSCKSEGRKTLVQIPQAASFLKTWKTGRQKAVLFSTSALLRWHHNFKNPGNGSDFWREPLWKLCTN